MSVSIQFLGAAETVTGSCYLVESSHGKFLVDCGMFQGPDVEERNLEDFEFDPSQIDFMILTHAHLDHVGLIPKLVRGGFKGLIYCTYHTAQIAEIVMMDSAKIQENNYSRGIPWTFAGKVELIYDTRDAQIAVELLETQHFDEEFEPIPGIKIRLVKAAHILGAASAEIEIDGKVVVFSGDIGRKNHDLIGGFDEQYKREVDYVVMESLYGGVDHPPRSESVNELINITRETIERGGSVYIPCFAVQRSQEIINDFKIAVESGALPDDVEVWLDSPMAQRVTEIYSYALDHQGDSLFNFDGMKYVKYYKQSARLHKKKGIVVIAGSGMVAGGRILGHLSTNISNSKNSVVLVGFQAEETLGRSLSEGAKNIHIDTNSYKVKAAVHHLQGFSAHAGDSDLKAWFARYNSPRLKQTFLVHAELDRAKTFKQEMDDNNLDHPYIPKWKEKVVLN